MSRVVIFGVGSFAETAHFYLVNDSEHEVVAFTVHEKYIKQTTFRELPVVPFEKVIQEYPPGDFQMFIGLGARRVNLMRASVYHEAKRAGYKLVTYLSSKCTHWGDTLIGDNCFILEDNTIQPFVTIGNDVVLWSGNHIGHRCVIGDHTFITSHVVVSGHVQIGSYCYLGVNATLRDSIKISDRCIIGAGAIVMKSTSNGELYKADRTKADIRSSDEIGF